jgi:hypothetical protein
MKGRLLNSAMDLAIATAQFGARVLTDEEAQKAVYISQQLESAGLGKLSDLMQALTTQGSVDKKALLSLVYALTLIQQAGRGVEILNRQK